MNLSGYVGHVIIFRWTITTAYCSVIGLGLGLDLVSGWLVVTHTYLYYFTLSLSLSLSELNERDQSNAAV